MIQVIHSLTITHISFLDKCIDVSGHQAFRRAKMVAIHVIVFDVFSEWWNIAFQFVPLRTSPALLTSLGFLSTVISSCLTIAYAPKLIEEVRIRPVFHFPSCAKFQFVFAACFGFDQHVCLDTYCQWLTQKISEGGQKHRRTQGGQRGHAPKILNKCSPFVLWEAFC